MSRFDQISDLSPKSVLQRGGRIVKWKGRTASMVPHVAELRLSVSAAAVGAALMFGMGIGGAAPTMAGSCTESPAGSGDFVCSGPVALDGTQVLSAPGPVTVTTQADFGIYAVGDALEIDGVNGTSFDDAEASTISATQSGIIINNTGANSLSFTSNGTVGGTYGNGIFATNGVGTSDLTISSNVVNGGENGLAALNFGTGALTITSTGTATGAGRHGIAAGNGFSGTNLTANTADVAGGENGIDANNFGTGALTITSTGMASGIDFAGISAENAGTDLTVNAADTSGGEFGIRADNNGTGALTIISSGTATGALSSGIEAYNSATGTDLTVNAVDTSGGDYGIVAFNFGTGALTINSTGTASGTTLHGISALNIAGGTELAVNAVDTSGGRSGIIVLNNGTGAITITSTGMASGIDFAGISAENAGTNLTVNAVEASGGEFGIRADNNGTGALTITAMGTATGTAHDGIYALNAVYASALSITAVDVAGGENGIDANNFGTGAITITSTGMASGTNYIGIRARNEGTDLTVNAVDTSGGEIGIFAINFGTGALTITSTGTATGTANEGIYALNAFYGSALSITAADVAGGENGIFASNFGTGALTITSTGTASGTDINGIEAFNFNNGTDLTINAVDTSGGNTGIFVFNDGSGALTINSTGTATGANATGIHARNYGTFGTALTIDAVDTSGGTDGIRARNEGTGALTITSTGTASGTNYMGIQAINEGTDLTVNAVDTSGGFHGIFAVNEGIGALSVTSTGTATGTDFSGIRARNHGTELAVNAADTSGSYSGISAENNGVGALTITSSGMAAGAANDGIYADNSINGTALTVSAVETSGGENGIFAINFGTGVLTINSTGTATGTTYHGIAALNIAGGTELAVKAVDTIGGRNGIAALNEGIGALTIISTGAATGIDSNGIGAENSGTDLTVKAVDTSGGNSGIVALNNGSGALTISSTGMATGMALSGILATNSPAGTSLSVTAADVSGGIDGINVLQEGSEPALITTSGTVAGGTGNAITAVTTGTAITVNNSGTLESGAGFALAASGGVTDLTNSGTINGRVQLSALDDEVFNTGTFNATMDSEFGAGNDLFTNNGKVIVEGTITLAGLEQFVNNNVINMANRTVGDSLTVPGDYVGNGSLGIDVSFDGAGSSDILVVSGSARGNTSLVINDVSTAPNFGNQVLVVDAGAGTVADAFSLSAESVTIGFVSYSVSFDAAGNDFFLSSAIGAPVFQTLKFVEGAQSLWHRSTDAWSAHMASPKDRSASPMWMQIDSSATGENDSFNFTSGGFAQNISLDYNQDYLGFQLGYEFGPGVTSDGILFGFTSGYLNSNLGFVAMADNVRYDAFNIGAYAGFKSEGFFANALAKYDIIDADVIARTAGYTADLNGEAYGVRLEASYRWGDEGFFVQPMASIEYQRASLDDFSTLGADIDFDTFDSLNAMAGVRLGGESKIDISNTLAYYLNGQVVHQSQSDDGLLFTSGISSIQIQNQLSSTFGRFEMGLSIATRGGVTGFIGGNAYISGDYTGYGGRGGLKVQF